MPQLTDAEIAEIEKQKRALKATAGRSHGINAHFLSEMHDSIDRLLHDLLEERKELAHVTRQRDEATSVMAGVLAIAGLNRVVIEKATAEIPSNAEETATRDLFNRILVLIDALEGKP